MQLCPVTLVLPWLCCHFFVTLISEFLSSLSSHLPSQPAPWLHMWTCGTVHKMSTTSSCCVFPEDHTIFLFSRLWCLMAVPSQGSLSFIPTGLGVGIIVTEGIFCYTLLALVKIATTAICKKESYLWRSLEYSYYLTLLEEESSDERKNDFLGSYSYMGILSWMV